MPKTYGTVATFTAGSVLTAAQLNVASGAVNNLVVPPACRLIQAAAQTIPTSVTTTLVFGAESYDTDTMHDLVTNNSRITIQTPGIYIITASVGLTSTPVSAFEFRIDVNNGTRLAEDNALGGSGYKSVSATAALIASDYIEAKLYLDGPRDTRYAAFPQITHLAATWIGRTS